MGDYSSPKHPMLCSSKQRFSPLLTLPILDLWSIYKNSLGYSRFSSVFLAIIMCCECLILQTLFPYYASWKCQLFGFQCSFCSHFSWNFFVFHVFSPWHLSVERHLCYHYKEIVQHSLSYKRIEFSDLFFPSNEFLLFLNTLFYLLEGTFRLPNTLSVSCVPFSRRIVQHFSVKFLYLLESDIPHM